MIAAGLCMMGGCFAQMDDSSVVDAYWPAEFITLEKASSLVVLYRFSGIPAGTLLSECSMECLFQHNTYGVTSEFAVSQGGVTCVTVYSKVDGLPGFVDIQTTKNGATNVKRANFTSLPQMIDFCFRDGAGYIPSLNLENKEVVWNVTAEDSRVTALYLNTAQSLFFYSRGSWGRRWYLLPMRSVGKLQAAFDFEQKVLVEI